MKSLFYKGVVAAVLAAVVVGCTTTEKTSEAAKPVEQAKSVEPVIPEMTGDPNPFADYGKGMASDKDLPMAVEWHNQTAATLAKETEFESLVQYVMLPKNADDLLAQVKEAYKTDPMVATKIAGVSQIVMSPRWNKAPAAREIWTCALLGAAEKAPDEYRKMFFLDQLRWCGKNAQADKVLAVGQKSGSKAVNDFAVMVAKELKEAK